MTQTYIYNTLKNNFNDDTYNKLVKQFGKPDVDFMIMHTDLNPQKALELKEKRKDSTFRKNVLERFNRKCIITKNQEEECEIAHILPFCECNELQKYDVNNGLLLSANIHKLFDKYIFSINPFTFSIEVKKDKIYTISDYEGMKLNLHIENIPYLEKHYNKFLKV